LERSNMNEVWGEAGSLDQITSILI